MLKRKVLEGEEKGSLNRIRLKGASSLHVYMGVYACMLFNAANELKTERGTQLYKDAI